MILEHEGVDVFLGLDVGKTGHHAVALNRAGKKLYDKTLPQDETQIRRSSRGSPFTEQS